MKKSTGRCELRRRKLSKVLLWDSKEKVPKRRKKKPLKLEL